MTVARKDTKGYLLGLLAVFAAYALTGKMGLSFEAVNGFASLVWPPTGIAIAAMLLYGRRLWPAVFLGAFVVNYTTGAPLGSALGMAAGNALEALVAASLLGLDGRFRHTLEDPRSVFAFIGLAAGMSTLISATVGTTSLWLGGVISAQAFASTWMAWWVGDIFGALVVAPFLLVWLGRRHVFEKLRTLGPEILMTSLAFVGVGLLMYSDLPIPIVSPTAASYIMMIPLVWAGVRFGMRGATAAILVFSMVSVYATALGRGPFAAQELNEGLVTLHLFVGASSIMALFLGSAHDERIRADKGSLGLQEELEEKARYLKSIVDLAPIGIKLIDYETRVVQVNAAGLKMLAADSIADLKDHPLSSMLDKDDLPAFDALLKRVFDGKTGGMRQGITDLRGAHRVFDVKMVPFRDAKGDVAAALGMFDDQTHEVEQERQLKAGYEDLAQMNRALIGRELKMIEMKKDLKRLKDEDGGNEKGRT